MDNPIRFLDNVLVANFAKSYKRFNRETRKTYRVVETTSNPHPTDEYTVIGITSRKEGRITWEGEEVGSIFEQTASKQVYIVAKSIGIRKLALLEDLMVVKDRVREGQ